MLPSCHHKQLRPRHLSRGALFLTILLILFCCPAATAAENIRTGLTINTNPAATTATQPPVQTVPCTAPCECLLPSEASSKWAAGYTQCSATPCGYSGGLASAPVAKYCYKQKTVSIINIPTTTLTQISVNVPACGTGLTLCAGKGCVNLKTDSSNCGGCGQGCTVGKSCENGQCVIKPKEYTTTDPCLLESKITCNGKCVDIHGSDNNNCGGCGWQCPGSLTCYQGECTMICPGTLTDCQYNCVDLLNDPENCGQCGNRCPGREACSNGKCTKLCNMDPKKMDTFSWADWRGVNWMTVAKGQGSCGSCFAEAPTGIAEAMYNIEQNTHENLDLSEQWFVSGCSGEMGSCLGGSSGKVYKALKDTGVPEESVMPYQSATCGYHDDPPGSDHYVCNNDCNGGSATTHCSLPHYCNPAVLAPDTVWKVTSTNPYSIANAWTNSDAFEKVKKGLLCYGPMSACSGHWWHCVDLVGWRGTEWTPGGGWIVKNSWGATYNGNGYEIVPYGDPYSSNKNDHGDLIRDLTIISGVYVVD